MKPPSPDAARLLAAAEAVCVSTGAGMSVESGLETFRGEDGFWSQVNVEEMATPQAFRRDPVKVWAWYRHRRQKLAQIEPHEGHRVWPSGNAARPTSPSSRRTSTACTTAPARSV